MKIGRGMWAAGLGALFASAAVAAPATDEEAPKRGGILRLEDQSEPFHQSGFGDGMAR